jgi:hypothetical protein
LAAASASFVPRDQSPLLLGQGGIDMQQERIGIGAQLGHDEGHPVLHQAGDVVDVPAQPIELGHDDRRLALAGKRTR